MHPAGKFQATESDSSTSSSSIAGRSLRRYGSLAPAVLATAALTILLAGCGASYRPVVSAINPVGPAGQPTKYAVAVSNPGTGLPGLLTIVDFSGDTILSTPSILANPSYFTLTQSGSQGYAINAAGALDSFPVTNPTSLRTPNIIETTLLAGANPVSISPLTGTPGQILYISQPGRTSVASLNANGPSLLQELSVGTNPVYVVGNDNAPRAYALSAGNGTTPGQVAAIETSTTLPTISATIPVGINPVYGVMGVEDTRAYILNKGSGTVSVINVTTNALDSTTPTIPANGTLGLNPVWAEMVPVLSEMMVLNAGDGTNPGSVSIISVPLCSSVTQPTNPSCNSANPTDAVGFGTVIATVPVGQNPVMVSALRDGSRAYVANAKDTIHCGPNGDGSVSIINLATNSISSTICAVSAPALTVDPTTSPTLIYGHPNSIAVTLASPTGKVYVTAGDNKYMTVIRTDTDAVTTHISLQGNGLRVMMTAP